MSNKTTNFSSHERGAEQGQEVYQRRMIVWRGRNTLDASVHTQYSDVDVVAPRTQPQVHPERLNTTVPDAVVNYSAPAPITEVVGLMHREETRVLTAQEQQEANARQLVEEAHEATS